MSFHKKLERFTSRAKDIHWSRRSIQSPPNVDQLDKPPASTTKSIIDSDSPSTSRSRTPTSNPRDTKNTDDSLSILPCLSSTSASAGAPTGIPAARSADSSDWTSLGTLSRVLDQSAGVFGPLKMVVNELVECIAMYERAASSREEYNALRSELANLFEVLAQQFVQELPPKMTASIESLCMSIHEELGYIQEERAKRTISRYLGATEYTDKVLICYRRIQGYLHRIMLNANLSMWKIMDSQATDAHLARLAPSLSACYNSAQAMELKRGVCTPGTRIDVLGQMHGWIHDPATGPVYWMNGMAGTGKTTIAYSLCAELDAAHELGASFFCSRLLPECRDINAIIPSIAYQLARFSRPFRYALSQALEKEPDAYTRLVRVQFEALLAKPLAEIQETLPSNLVVVIDALDECENKETTGQILDVLLTQASNLPIKFLVSSRPEPEIRERMLDQDKLKYTRLVLHEMDQETVRADVEAYLRAALAPINPTDRQIATLVERTGILFIYAATAVRYIGYGNFRRNPYDRLETVLNTTELAGSNKNKEIDELYTTILSAALGEPGLDERDREDIKLVLHTVICARESLAVTTISKFLGLASVDRVRAALQPLWSVLHIAGSGELVTPLHASFLDFMFDRNRSKEYHCDSTTHSHLLARLCLDCLGNSKPQFNICGLESSYIHDTQVTDIEERVHKAISPQLLYSSRYWAVHLESAEGTSVLVNQLYQFLSVRLLLWTEILNLTKHIHTAVDIMRRAEDWVLRQGCPSEIIELARDAWRFVAIFASSPVSRSTPHIYLSMLPFWPRSSPIAKHYLPRIRGMVEPQGTAMARRRPALLTTWFVGDWAMSVAFSPDGTKIALAAGDNIHLLDSFAGTMTMLFKGHSATVRSVAFSPDGTRIASGSDDNTIRLWNAQNGQLVLSPLEGHTNLVTSVTFSPDGTRVASGSRDKAICIWDAQHGRMALGPLRGHANEVTSVKFSNDGMRIVSGSVDTTIRLWDTHDGSKVFGPLKGHTHWVTSVSFSPDDSRIISGSRDKTICVWDSQTGQLLLGPLSGHAASINSVDFSPDGARLVSGAADRTLRVWDVQTGRVLLGPLEGHLYAIESVAYSPDGTRIVSCSGDKTIHLWDARGSDSIAISSLLERHSSPLIAAGVSSDGTLIVPSFDSHSTHIWDVRSGRITLGPLKGHNDRVTSAAFSPDGTRIVTGSADNTMLVWDSQDGTNVLGPLIGHTNWVLSVGFSPDGSRIVSGSRDKTIRIWDAQNGLMLVGPLQGHTHFVTSVAFSLDATRIVTGSYDTTVRVWDSQNGQMVLDPLRGHSNAVKSAHFSLDGIRIISCSKDNDIHIWEAQTGHVLYRAFSQRTSSVAFTECANKLSLSTPAISSTSTWIDSDGWVVDDRFRLLVWVPVDLRATLICPRSTSIVAPAAYLQLNLDDAWIGESWIESYQSA